MLLSVLCDVPRKEETDARRLSKGARRNYIISEKRTYQQNKTKTHDHASWRSISPASKVEGADVLLVGKGNDAGRSIGAVIYFHVTALCHDAGTPGVVRLAVRS